MPSKKHIVFPVPCAYCSEPLTLKTHTWDHKVPRSEGGKSTPENLNHACANCNSRKGSRPLVEFLAEPIPPARPPRKSVVARRRLAQERREEAAFQRLKASGGVVIFGPPPAPEKIPRKCPWCKQARSGCADCRG